MANRSTAPGRIMLMGLVVAGAVAGMTGTAAAQYDYYDDAPYPIYGYGYRYDYGYARRAPAPVPPHAVGRIAARDYGLVRIERSIRRDDTYILDGITAGGQRQGLILDAYAGELIRRIPLRRQPAPGIARADPREERAAPRQRLVPQPPERPATLKPPGEASAPATTAPPPAAAPPTPEPEKPAPTAPAEASAPATAVPPQAATPAQPSPGATEADKPRFVNPDDVRGIEGTDRQPPLATAAPTPEAPPLPPAQPADPTPSTPEPETPIAPVVPMP